VLVSASIDGSVLVWDMRKVARGKDAGKSDGPKSTTVLDTRHGRVVTSDCLMSSLQTKSLRLVGSQFTARNVLVVFAEFPAS
jgi:hypothetical protein